MLFSPSATEFQRITSSTVLNLPNKSDDRTCSTERAVPFFSEVSQDVRSKFSEGHKRSDEYIMNDIVSAILSLFPVLQYVQAQFDSNIHNKASIEFGINSLTTTSALSGHKFVPNVFSTVELIESTVNKQTNIANRTQIIKNPNSWEADQLVIYTTRSRS